MAHATYRTNLLHPAEEVYAWHARPGAFQRLLPSFENTQLLSVTPGPEGAPLSDGTRLVLAARAGPFRLKWHALHESHVPGESFTDIQSRGPFRRWRHVHRFIPLTSASSTLEDDIDYALPRWTLGLRAASEHVRARLDRLFSFRHVRTRNDLDRHAAFRTRPRLKVGVTGSSGSIGTALCAFLSTAGHHVIGIARAGRRGGERGSASAWSGSGEPVLWNPSRGNLERGSLDNLDAVIHLAGSPITAQRWTKSHKDAVRDSRVEGTRALCKLLAELNHPPKTFLSASGVGYYGDRQDDLLTEDSTLGSGVLAEVARDWEAATEPAVRAGIRTAVLRMGVVLDAAGGMLRRIMTPAKLGLLGRLGSGRQFISWIALDDCLASIETLLHEPVSGPVNLVSPNPVTQEEFVRTLAELLRRPRLLNMGSSVVRAVFGEMGDELLLRGQRVSPARLMASGFRFSTPDLASALRWQLGLGG